MLAAVDALERFTFGDGCPRPVGGSQEGSGDTQLVRAAHNEPSARTTPEDGPVRKQRGKRRLWLTIPGLVALTFVLPASAKTLDRAVLVGADGRWIRIGSTESDFENLARDPGAKPRPARGGFIRLYFVGPGDFPANRARYYPDQRCIALDWPTYERSCRAVRAKLVPLFGRSHSLPRFTQRPTALARLTYTSSGSARARLAALTGSIELALSRTGKAAAQPSRCYALAGVWHGPAAETRPSRLFLCRDGVFARGRLHALREGVWQWFRLNFGPP